MSRKEKQYHFIYKTTNKINGKYYVGMHSTDNLNDGYLGSGYKLRRSINKHGGENFKIEILEFLSNRSSLKVREKELVNEDLLKDPMCMNLMIGGEGGFISNKQQRDRSICANKKHNELLKTNETYRKNYIEKMKIASYNGYIKRKENGSTLFHLDWTGKTHKPKTIEKMKQERKGNGMGSLNSQFGTCWITNGKENKKIKILEVIPTEWKLGRILKQQKL
jgi:hypothetical protein